MVQYFKSNKIQTLEIITPKLYVEQDISLSGLQIRLESQIINSHLLFANSVSSCLYISSVDSLSAIAPYFIKQNKLTYITPYDFETDILLPLGYTYGSFNTSTEFRSYLSATLLPSIKLNAPTAFSHDELIGELGWFYFLNTSAATYSPSSFVAEKLTDLYFGKTLELVDGIKGLENFLWRNYNTCSLFQNLGLIPDDYVSGTGIYTSGTQQLDKLLTLIDVVYSPLLIDTNDIAVKDAFDDYISTDILLTDVESKGPLYRFLKAISYGYQDIDDEVSQINSLYDLEKCPDRFLPYIAELIGWHLFGHDPNRWRLQLKNAVSIYKAKGTKASLQAAIDSIFTEGFLDLSGSINELYESYIPYLIYYGLATESPVLSGFDMWTVARANSFGITDYSNQNMDTNIRIVVDSILLDTVRRFPDYFKFKGQAWNLNDPNFIFNYRGRNYPIPPFEEFKYYKDVEPINDQIDFIADKIACFGVSASFIEPFREFIKSYTTSTDDLLHLDNRWLFFYSGLQLPPNHNKLLSQLDKKRYDYVGLWGGKSSHFNLNILASAFTYSKRSVDASSTLVLQEALRAINAFTPAHAIPDINFLLTDTDHANYDEEEGTILDYKQDDFSQTSGFLQGYGISGTNMSSLSAVFNRDAADNVLDSPFAVTSVLLLPRNSQRRRSLHNLLPKYKLYSRTGFNMPIPQLLSSSLEDSLASSMGFLPLGLIPSAQQYISVSSVTAIPPIYSKCENLNSDSVYSGLIVSNTYPCRGTTYVASAMYCRRGDTDPIFALIYKILYKREIEYWRDYLNTSAGYTQFVSQIKYYDLSTSLANSSFAISSFNQYEDFEFGTGIHKIYKDWVTYFNRQNINYGSLDLSGGKDIFSHTYGPLLYNGKLDQYGSGVTTSAALVASSFDSILKINANYGSGILTVSGGSSVGTYVVSGNSTNNLNIRNEYRNSSILQAVEIVNTSGASLDNEFTMYEIHSNNIKAGYSNYLVNNPAIKLKAINGFPRLIYHFSSTSNILIPEHEFEGQIKYFPGFESGDKWGGAGIGVWIHTEPQNGKVWSWYKDRWEMMETPSSLTVNDINKYFLKHYTQLQTVEGSSVSGFAGQCYNTQTGQSAKLTLENITSSVIKVFNFNFNTLNYNILIPGSYYNDYQQVHKLTQNYVVEVFKLPGPDTNSYILLDEVSIIDKTENDRAEEYTASQLLIALRYMKDIADNRASRQASVTSGTYYTSGGSRANYRIHPDWAGAVKNSFSQVSAMDFIN